MVEIPQKYKDGYVKLSLTNVEVYWAHVQKADREFGNNKWHLQMRLDDKLAEELKAEGFNVKDKTDKQGNVAKNTLIAKKEVMKKNGQPNKQPYIKGPDGKTDFTDNIGNGSILNLNLSAKAWKIRGKWSLSCYLDGIQVVNHVPYAGGFSDVSEATEVPF